MAKKVRVPWRERYRTSKAIFRQGVRLMARERDLWRFPALATLLFVPMILLVTVAMQVVAGLDIVPMSMLPFVALVFLPLVYPAAVLASILNAALVYALYERMEGRPCTPGQAWRRARSQWRTIARFNVIALLVAGLLQFVGILLDKLNMVPWVGRVTQMMGALAWAAASFFVIPIIVVERERSAMDALKGSVSIARQQWGKAVAGMITISLALLVPYFLIVVGLSLAILPMVFLLGVGAMVAGFIVIAGLSLVAMVGMMFVSHGVNSAYQTALYRFARTGQVTAPFDQATLVDAWAPYRAA